MQQKGRRDFELVQNKKAPESAICNESKCPDFVAYCNFP